MQPPKTHSTPSHRCCPTHPKRNHIAVQGKHPVPAVLAVYDLPFQLSLSSCNSDPHTKSFYLSLHPSRDRLQTPNNTISSALGWNSELFSITKSVIAKGRKNSSLQCASWFLIYNYQMEGSLSDATEEQPHSVLAERSKQPHLFGWLVGFVPVLEEHSKAH